MNTEEPNIMADKINIRNVDEIKGMAEPTAILIKTIDKGIPFENLAKIGLHINGEMQMNIPSITQIAVIIFAFTDLAIIQADKNVR